MPLHVCATMTACHLRHRRTTWTACAVWPWTGCQNWRRHAWWHLPCLRHHQLLFLGNSCGRGAHAPSGQRRPPHRAPGAHVSAPARELPARGAAAGRRPPAPRTARARSTRARHAHTRSRRRAAVASRHAARPRRCSPRLRASLGWREDAQGGKAGARGRGWRGADVEGVRGSTSGGPGGTGGRLAAQRGSPPVASATSSSYCSPLSNLAEVSAVRGFDDSWAV